MIASSNYGETVTILAMGKDAFGVNLTQFSKLKAWEVEQVGISGEE